MLVENALEPPKRAFFPINIGVEVYRFPRSNGLENFEYMLEVCGCAKHKPVVSIEARQVSLQRLSKFSKPKF